MPFGLCNAPATFETLVDQVLQGMQWEGSFLYLDDICLSGKTLAQVASRLEQVLIHPREIGEGQQVHIVCLRGALSWLCSEK